MLETSIQHKTKTALDVVVVLNPVQDPFTVTRLQGGKVRITIRFYEQELQTLRDQASTYLVEAAEKWTREILGP